MIQQALYSMWISAKRLWKFSVIASVCIYHFPSPSFLITFFLLHTLISLCSKVSNWMPLSLHRGHEVWVIAGEKKGHQAHLVDLGCQSSIISMFGYSHFEIKNTDVVTR